MELRRRRRAISASAPPTVGSRSGSSGRPREITVEIRTDGQIWSARSRAGTSSCRQCSRTGAIDRPTWEGARASKVVLEDSLRAGEPHGQYFKEQVRLELVERFGWERVYQGGLRVFTTLDMPMQIAAEAAAAASLKTIDGRRQALAARRAAAQKNQRPRRPIRTRCRRRSSPWNRATGYVRAMVGGRDFEHEPLQPCRAGAPAARIRIQAVRVCRRARGRVTRRPASSTGLNDPIATLQGAWVPADGHSTADSMTLRTGLRTSSNRAAVRLLQEIGIPRAVQYAQTMGVGDVPSVPSLALGSGEVTLASMTAAYAAFANQGRVPKPIVIRRVEDRDGRLLFEAQVSSARAISETTAFLMSNMLADVINAGTAAGARGLGFKLPAAGKTGTTNDYNDAWFIGYTPKLVTGVWVGFDQPQHDSSKRVCGRCRRAVLGDVHEGGDAERRARLVQAAAGRVDRHRLPDHGQARGRGLRARGGGRQQRRGRDAVDGLHRILRPRHRADRVLRPAFGARNLRDARGSFLREAAAASLSRKPASRRATAAIGTGGVAARAGRDCRDGDARRNRTSARDTTKRGASGRASSVAGRDKQGCVIRSRGRVSVMVRGRPVPASCRFET